jgi:hypothetical protein
VLSNRLDGPSLESLRAELILISSLSLEFKGQTECGRLLVA